jgi:hypothetical protein
MFYLQTTNPDRNSVVFAHAPVVSRKEKKKYININASWVIDTIKRLPLTPEQPLSL